MNVEAVGIGKVYGSPGDDAIALRDVSLRVSAPEQVAITGPSGCGKSTLLSLLGLLARPSTGRVLFDGTDVSSWSVRSLAGLRNARIGFVFQMFNLLADRTVQDNVGLPLRYGCLPRRERRLRVAWALDRVGLSRKAARLAGQLSGGEQQRTAIARAIVSRPRLMLADEPTGNLDSENGLRVLALLRSLSDEGASLILVTHNPAIAQSFARIVRLRDGRLVGDAAGTGSEAS